MPKISIITPSHNCKNYFLETFNSVINQTYIDFEWIIVDDCSTDDSYSFIENKIKFHSNIKLFKTDKNGGSAKARNLGLNNATGKYITFLDSDDVLDSNYLEEQIKFIKRNGPIITAGYRRIHNKSNTPFYPRKSIDYKGLLVGNDASCLTTMYDKSIIGDVYFPENIMKQEDYVFWLNILKKGYVIKGNQKILATYRIHHTGKNRNKKGLIKHQFYIYHKVLKFNFIKSCYHILRWGLYGIKKYRGV